MADSIERKQDKGRLVIGASFAVLLFILVYKLTNASLWYDEVREFYSSKIFWGTLPWETAPDTMYKRIISTFQPPLYNFLMYFWLKISESQWWFRFFGVVTGMISGIGVYKSVEKLWNYKAAAVSVLILGCTKQFVYYSQECAEYTLLLAGISWLVYTWICLMENITPKRLAGYLIAAVISVYSQYGACFPVAAFSIILLVSVLPKNNKRDVLQVIAGYAATLIFAALPLWFFFMSKQIANQQGSTTHAFS